MFKQYFANMESTAMPLIALWLFLGVFVVVALRVFVFKTTSDFATDAQLPLDDGTAISTREVKS